DAELNALPIISVKAASPYRARRHRIDVDVVRCPFAGKGLREVHDARAGRRSMCVARRAAFDREHDVDDAAATTTRDHTASKCVRDLPSSDQIEFDNRTKPVCRDVDRRGGELAACVVDENVGTAPAQVQLIEELRHLTLDTDVNLVPISIDTFLAE